MFYIIRFIIIVIIGVLLSYITLRFIKHPKVRMAINIVAFVVIVFIVGIINFESIVYSFSSPEEAFNYNSKADIISLVIEGEESSCVVGLEDDTTIIKLIPKVDNGWKSDSGLATKAILNKVSSDCTTIISVYQFKNTEDYYIRISNIYGNIERISDNKNSDFLLEKINSETSSRQTFYAYIENWGDDYVLTINNQKISLKTEEQFFMNTGDGSLF